MLINIIFLPKRATPSLENLNSTSILLRLVGTSFTYDEIAYHIRSVWKPLKAFKIRRVESQSFVVRFHARGNFSYVADLKWS